MPQPAPAAVKVAYRPDIDGLRAVAVLLVLADHLGTRLTGGYIGVDVFFVISGFLISGIILRDLNAGRFSIADFYERRVRRIFPALVVMMLVTAILGLRYLVPSELRAFGSSTIAAIFSASNILFWLQAGYFDGPSLLKPLLHTWSLGVEEQFYLFFPLFLIAVRRWIPRFLKPLVWTIAIASLVLACVWVRRDATAAFFLAPLRAWELLAGTIVSQNYVPVIRSRVARELASAAGLLLLLSCALVYTSETLFPGLSALPPCLGAALIIAAGASGTSLVGRLLASPPIIFIGAISYSLYLWHWPILVFQRTGSMLSHAPDGSLAVQAQVFAASMLAAMLSWRFVETPFRHGRSPQARSRFFAAACAGAVGMAAVGAVIFLTHGLPFLYPQAIRKLAASSIESSPAATRIHACYLIDQNNFADRFTQFQIPACLDSVPGSPNYLLLGDSHAAHMYRVWSAPFPKSTSCRQTSRGAFRFRRTRAIPGYARP